MEHVPVATGFINDSNGWSRRFAVRGVFWRKALDWAVLNVPAVFHPPLIWLWSLFFFFFAAPARKAIYRQLAVILPGSSRFINYFRVLRVFHNFAWSLTDSAAFRLLKASFAYELTGKDQLDDLVAADRAIILTAHMGNYDLGAALFIEELKREIRMVRAPEPDELTAHHVDRSLEQSSGGAMKVDYNTAGTSLSFDLLAALRAGQIISIQGDRVVGDVARSPVKLFGHEVLLPTGPFVLSLVAETPIYPLFVVRDGFRRYKIIAEPPIRCRKDSPREIEIAAALQKWSQVLEEKIRLYWQQWYAFAPLFDEK
ncbi:MAG: lysophospholipid acyltransferase family protein [Verrucomicrobiota bacterium]